MDFDGYVDELTAIGLQGWAVDRTMKGAPAVVRVRFGKELLGLAVANQMREDVKSAGNSESARCGFRFLFPHPIPAERLREVTVTINGVDLLPVVKVGPSTSFDLLFNGSFGKEISDPVMAFLSPHYLRDNWSIWPPCGCLCTTSGSWNSARASATKARSTWTGAAPCWPRMDARSTCT